MSEEVKPEVFVVALVEAIYGNAAIGTLVPKAAFPVTVMSPAVEFTVADAEALDRVVGLLRRGFAEAGIAGVRCEVRSVMRPNDGLAVVQTLNQRLGIRGEDMGLHRSTYVVRIEGGAWRLVALSVDDEQSQSAVRERIEALLRAEGIVSQEAGARGETE